MIARELQPNEEYNPEIHLGYGGAPIDVKLFKGLYSDADSLYSSNPYGSTYEDVQVYVNRDCKSVSLMNSDVYLTLEDIQSFDKWLRLGFAAFGGEINFTQYSSPTDTKYKELYEEAKQEYWKGEQSEIYKSEKVFNEKGEYMYVGLKFNPNREENPINRVRDHITFITPMKYWSLPLVEREFNVEGPHYKVIELMVELYTKHIAPSLHKMEIQRSVEMGGIDLMGQFINTPFTGKLNFIINEDLPHFIVKEVIKEK